jgi:hypothetical protein
MLHRSMSGDPDKINQIFLNRREAAHSTFVHHPERVGAYTVGEARTLRRNEARGRRHATEKRFGWSGEMSAMSPLFDAIFGLEGFEKAAFWLGMFIAFLGAGFFIDFLMHKQGFGIFWNALYVFIAGFAGLYIRYNYFQRSPYSSYEPFVTAGLLFGSIAVFLTMMSFLRNRFW